MARLDEDLGIGDVARETGLSVHALRFYEREGLMLSGHVARGTGGRRRYSPEDVNWLRICIKLRASGMPLAKIRRLAELVREGPGNERERLELLREQQRRVENQLAELQECLRIISRRSASTSGTSRTAPLRISGRPRHRPHENSCEPRRPEQD